MKQRITRKNFILLCLICSIVVLSFYHATEPAFLSHPISHSENSQGTLSDDSFLSQNTTISFVSRYSRPSIMIQRLFHRQDSSGFYRSLGLPFSLFLIERILFGISHFLEFYLPLFSIIMIIHIIRYIHKADGKSRTILFA